MWPLLQLFTCTSVTQSFDFDPSATEWTPEVGYIIDAMPLVAPLTQAEATTLYPNDNFQEACMKHFEAQAPLVDFVEGNIQQRTVATQPSTQIDFREYFITHNSATSQPVYALTTGFLFYLTAGQSLPSLLGGTQVRAGETLLVLLPIQTIWDRWKESHPGNRPLLDQCAYLNIDLVSDLGSSDTDPCLKNLIKSSTTREYYNKVYDEYTGDDLPADENWEDIYIQLFKTHPEIPIVVQGGKQIGWTKTYNGSASPQHLMMFFSFEGAWNSLTDETVKPFFRYFKRRPGLAGHPLIAKLLQQSVRAGTVDVIKPYSEQGLRSKLWLNSEFARMESSGSRTHHPLAIDPDQHPHRVIVPCKPDPVPENPTFRDDHWVTLLNINNPLEVTIEIQGSIPGLTITPRDFQAKNQIVEIKLDGILPDPIETTIQIVVKESTGNSTAFDLILRFLNFYAIPVRFYKLANMTYNVNIDEAKLSLVIAYANEILGRQANVYIYPIPVDENVVTPILLHPLAYIAGDLGDPILFPNLGGHGAEEVWSQMASLSVLENIKVVFIWDLKVPLGDDPVGSTLSHPFEDERWKVIMIETKVKGGFDATYSYLAKILVHELGHWFAESFIVWKNNFPECSNGHEDFDHGQCSGDWQMTGNIMTPERENLLITTDQADIYNKYAHEVLP